MSFLTRSLPSLFKQGLVMQPKYVHDVPIQFFGGNKDGIKKPPTKDKAEKGKTEKPAETGTKKPAEKPAEKKKWWCIERITQYHIEL